MKALASFTQEESDGSIFSFAQLDVILHFMAMGLPPLSYT